MNELDISKLLNCARLLMIDYSSRDLKELFEKNKLLEYLIIYINYAIENERWLLFQIPKIKDNAYYILNEMRFLYTNDDDMITAINRAIIDLNNLDYLVKNTYIRPSFCYCVDEKLDYDDYNFLGATLEIEAEKRDLTDSPFKNLSIINQDNLSLVGIGPITFLGQDFSSLAQNVMISMLNDATALYRIALGDLDSCYFDFMFLSSTNALLQDYTFWFTADPSFCQNIEAVINYSLDNLNEISDKRIRKLYQKSALVTLERVNEIKELNEIQKTI